MAIEPRLYAIDLSPPALATRLALRIKDVDFGLTNLPAGFHPVLVRAAGFPAGTVPALLIDGERVQGSREITAYLDRTRGGPPLFGHGAAERAAIEAAEEWGDLELQPIPRRIFRHGANTDERVIQWLAVQQRIPLPTLAARLSKPIAWRMARISAATSERVRADVEGLPATFDRIDELIADGTIGGEEPNAADLQIFTSVRSLMGFPDLEPLLAGRQATKIAERLVPPLPGPMPRWLPPEWLRAAADRSSQTPSSR